MQKVVLFAMSLLILFFQTPNLRAETILWSYDGTNNPQQWGHLSRDFALCEVGNNQSPIEIDHTVNSSLAKIEFNYTSTPLVVVNNGRTVQVNYQPGSTININNEEYELLQFHFHTPSEHKLLGKIYPLELHLVHRNRAGKLAVVGIMIEEGVANPLVAKIWQYIPQKVGKNTVETLTINAAKLLPNDVSYVSYLGSLTTPPCSEEVKWKILINSISISPEQITKFQTLYHTNARPIQVRNRPIVKLHQQQ